ncbi:MAG: TadE/TadG family type IV pilus assembly protein [Blastocatellales bacterium]
MNGRLYPLYLPGSATNDQSGDYHDVVAPGVTLKRMSSRPTGRPTGGFRLAGPTCGLRRISEKMRERGQAMVEIAFVLPLFLILVFAIIEMGRAWAAKQALTIAAREGARILVLPYGAGLTYASESDVQNAALNAVRDSMNGSGTPVTASTQINVVRITPGNDGVLNTADDQIEQNYTGGKRGERVGIQLTYPFETPAPVLLRMFDSGGGSSTQSVITMAMTCYMDHE